MRRVALLVVHGIGSQKRGETLANCVAGLKCAYPDAALSDRNGTPITAPEISANELEEAILCQPSWQVHLYEVYWAPTLAGRDVEESFNKFLFEETTWFPWFNWKCGLLPRGQYSRLLIGVRTVQMWLAQLAATVLYEIVPKGLHGTVLDQIVADVWNYTHSLGGSLEERSPINGAGKAIVDCFRQTVRRAHRDGCEELQIIAHSLGTVVAYNALTRYPSPAPNEAPMPITRFFTIGSPLEKFLFIWTRLLRPSINPEIQIDGVAIASGPEIRWTNFYSPLDLVSGKLKRFREWGQVENKRVWGLGGLSRAHVGYFQSPAVIAELAASLGGHPQAVKISLAKRILSTMVGIGENLAVPSLVVLALLVGLALILFTGALLGAFSATLLYALVGWLVNLVLGYFEVHISFASAVAWSSIVGAAWMVVGLVLFTTKDGFRRARDAHRRFWQCHPAPKPDQE